MAQIYTKDEIQALEAILFKFCQKNGLNLTNKTDIVSVCNSLDIGTYNLPLSEDNLDGVILIDQDIRAIGVDEALDPFDKRFVIAHELGHYIFESIIHDESGENGDSKLIFAERDKILHGNQKSEKENQTDYLAAAILVPLHQFKKDLIEKNKIKDFNGIRTIKDVYNKISISIIEDLSEEYRVKAEVIVRRIAEVAQLEAASNG